MSHTDVSLTPIPEDDAAHAQSDWTASRIASLAIGTVLALLALMLIAAAGTALWADRTQRDDGYVTTDQHQFSSSGLALVTEETQLGAAGVGWLYGPGLLGKVRIRVTPRDAGSKLFVGIGRSTDVDRYLSGVARTVISEFFKGKSERVDGGKARSAPAAQRFWVAFATAPGRRPFSGNRATGTGRSSS